MGLVGNRTREVGTVNVNTGDELRRCDNMDPHMCSNR